MKHGLARTKNVELFLAGVMELEQRGAREANMLLVTGAPGSGKTSCLLRWTNDVNAIYLLGGPKLTPNWVLGDLILALGEKPLNSQERRELQARRLLARSGQAIVLDEAHYFLQGKAEPLEVIRKITARGDNSVILATMEDIREELTRHQHIADRIVPTTVRMVDATVDDVRLCFTKLAEVDVADDLVCEVHHHTRGRYRLVKNAIALVERFAVRNKLSTVKQTDMVGEIISHDWRDNSPCKVRQPRLRKAS
ncbi:MAG: ATP-binding protein [Magnetococcales bacterium]|nr:ATP-binding protein [Magnetococcales bacterium]